MGVRAVRFGKDMQMRAAVMTDTNSGMSLEEGARRGIFVLPMPIMIDHRGYLEGDSIAFEQIFAAMEAGKTVTTSHPSPGEICALWDHIFAMGYDEIVCIPMSSGLSSFYQTASYLAREYDGRVFVADNHRISLTLYESVLDAKAMADEGASAEEICSRLEEKAYDATIYLTVASLDHLRRGGRLSAAVAAIGTILKIHPIMKIGGEKLEHFARVRGRLAAARRMIEATFEELHARFPDRAFRRTLVGAAGTLTDPAAIEDWSSQIRRRFPEYPFLYHPLACSVACHTGPGAFGTGFVCMDRVK